MEKRKQTTMLIKGIYKIVEELEALWPDRRFTPDGHMVGSIGEVLAADDYGLTLFPAGAKGHDAVSKDGRKIQIKATQKNKKTKTNKVGLRSKPEHLLVLQILENGKTKGVYNGPGEPVWKKTGKRQSNGQKAITILMLSELFKCIPKKDRLKRVAF